MQCVQTTCSPAGNCCNVRIFEDRLGTEHFMRPQISKQDTKSNSQPRSLQKSFSLKLKLHTDIFLTLDRDNYRITWNNVSNIKYVHFLDLLMETYLRCCNDVQFMNLPASQPH